MATIISTVLFNGQFWIALVEKIEADGSLLVGKYTFGSEPTNNDLKDFYLNRSHLLTFHKSDEKFNTKKKDLRTLNMHIPAKSMQIYKEEQKKYLLKKKKEKKNQSKEDEKKKYQLKCIKRKKLKRGH